MAGGDFKGLREKVENCLKKAEPLLLKRIIGRKLTGDALENKWVKAQINEIYELNKERAECIADLGRYISQYEMHGRELTKAKEGYDNLLNKAKEVKSKLEEKIKEEEEYVKTDLIKSI